MLVGPRCWVVLLILSLGWLRLWAQGDQPIEISAARIGAVYAYALETSLPAHFAKAKGNAEWLTVTREGILTGTPTPGAPATSEITVEASLKGSRIQRTFIVPVLPADCPARGSSVLAWCSDLGADPQAWRPEPEQRFAFQPREVSFNDGAPAGLECRNSHDGCIVQFQRLRGPYGEFGHFNPKKDRIEWLPESGKPDEPTSAAAKAKDLLINAINGSKVFLSGSVLIRHNVGSCPFWSWSVVTQSVNSSNNLFYGPSEVTAFCFDETALIVLPAHAIWASVYGTPANTNDPTWKPASGPPQGHECWTGETVTAGSPRQGIRPCDKTPSKHYKCPPGQTEKDCDAAAKKVSDEYDQYQKYTKTYPGEGSNPLLRLYYWRPIAWNYNRVTQPGVSQGSISISPIMPSTKATWDVQAYESTRLGPGWLGLNLMYEHDRKPADDLDSFTAALLYELRVANENRYWRAWGALRRDSKYCASGGLDGCSPPVIGLRPMEISLRVGPEWAPAPEKLSEKVQPTPAASVATDVVYLPRGLNLVGGLTAASAHHYQPDMAGPPEAAVPNHIRARGRPGGRRPDDLSPNWNGLCLAG